MKSLLSRNYNAMLMVCCRLGLRPNLVLTEIVIFIVLMVMAFLLRSGIFLFPGGRSAAGLLPIIFGIQGIILICGVARIMAAVRREKESGTLELHRLSPQSKFGIVLGFLLGAPVLEWFMALFLVLPIVITGVVIGLPFFDMVIYECSFFLGALMIGQCFMMLTLFHSKRRAGLMNSNYLSDLVGLIALSMFMVLIFLRFRALGLGPSSPSCYAFTPYALVHLVQSIMEHSYGETKYRIPIVTAFGLQALVHVPMLCLTVWVAIRNLKYPDRRLFSKAQAYAVVSMAYALYVAELFNNSRIAFKNPVLILLPSILTAFLGLIMVFLITPDYRSVLRERYLYRNESKKRWWRYFFSDGTSATYWLIGYFLLTCAAIIPVLMLVHSHHRSHLFRFATFLPLVCALSLTQIACFSEFLRVFLYGGFRRLTSLFPILLFLFWIVVPILVMAITEGRSSSVYWASLALSPIFSGVRVLSDISGDYLLGKSLTHFVSPLIWGIVLNLLLTCIFGSIALRLRKKITSRFPE